jgi:hypothetical protein
MLVAARSKAYICGPSLSENVDSIPVWGISLSLEMAVSAMGQPLVQRSPTECVRV